MQAASPQPEESQPEGPQPEKEEEDEEEEGEEEEEEEEEDEEEAARLALLEPSKAEAFRQRQRRRSAAVGGRGGRGGRRRPPPQTGSPLSRLFRVKKVQLQMLQYRGYDISGEARLLTDTIDEFERIYTAKALAEDGEFVKSMSAYYERPDGTDPIYVFYPSITQDSKQLSKSHLEPLYLKMRPVATVQHYIIISGIPLSSGSRRNLMTELPNRRSEHFLYTDLGFFIPGHSLVPRHTLLTVEERNSFLREQRISMNELSTMSLLDPMARFIGAQEMDLVKIERFTVNPSALVKNTLKYLVVRNVPITRKDE